MRTPFIPKPCLLSKPCLSHRRALSISTVNFMALQSLSLKRGYRCVPCLQQFYTGGAIVVSSDGSFIACACGDSIKIVDSSTSSLRSAIEGGESESFTALCLSPDDKLLFSAGHSRQIMVWDLTTLKCVRFWKSHDGPVMGMACHPSGGLLATAGADKKVLVWDVDGGFCTHYFKGHKSVVASILFHFDPDKQLLFSGSDDGSVRVWDLLTKKNIATLEHEATVTSLSISEDGWTLLSAGRDKVVKLWDLHNYSCKKTVITFEVLEGVCVIRAGTSFASCLSSHEQQKNENGGAVNFVTIGERGIVRVWSSESSICLYEQKSIDVAASVNLDDQRRGFTAAFLLPFDQGLLCVTADHQFLFYSPLKTPDNHLTITLSKRLVGSNEEIIDMKFLGEDEQFLAVATNVEQVRIYNLASMSCSYILVGHTEIVLCLDTCVSSLGKILIVTGSKDNNVRLWESESKSCVGVGLGHMGAVGAVAFSKKKRDFFVSGSSDRTIKVWSLDGLSDNMEQAINLKAKAIVAAHDKDINSLAVAPNDTLVCSGSEDRTACIWRLPDLVSIAVLRGHKRAVWSVEFSPVDQCVLTASGDKTIKIWAISDGSCLKTFEGHTASVLRASFLTRGTQIISCGADGLLKLWTVKTNECIATYDQHEDKVWALTVGRKTEMIATGGSDAVVNLWYDSTVSDREEALRKEEEVVLKGQELENALSDSDYTKAIQIALELRRPHRLFELFAELCRKRDAENTVGKVLGALEKEEFRLLFEYIREWNSKPKLCHVAHFVLFRVLNILSPKDIVELKGIGELLEGLIPYSQRHFSRVDRLVRSSFLLDYTLAEMSVVEPENDTNDADEPAQSLEKAKEKSTTKKRKPKKSKDVSYKKARAAADAQIAAISLQA